MKPLKAIIFDLDDVLYPQWEYALGGYRAVADYMMTVYGTAIYEELAQRYNSDRSENLLADVLAGHFENVEESFLNRLTAVYWSHTPCIKLFPDAEECLRLMKKLKIKTAVVTNGRPQTQRSKINALKLSGLVDPVLFAGDMLGEEKMRDSFQMSELLSDVLLSETAYAGNITSSDFQTAKALNMTTLWLKRPEHITGQSNITSRDAEETAQFYDNKNSIDFIIPSLAELHHTLQLQEF